MCNAFVQPAQQNRLPAEVGNLVHLAKVNIHVSERISAIRMTSSSFQTKALFRMLSHIFSITVYSISILLRLYFSCMVYIRFNSANYKVILLYVGYWSQETGQGKDMRKKSLSFTKTVNAALYGGLKHSFVYPLKSRSAGPQILLHISRDFFPSNAA